MARSMIKRSRVTGLPRLPKSRTSFTLRKKLTIAGIRHFENSRNVEVPPTLNIERLNEFDSVYRLERSAAVELLEPLERIDP